MKKVFSSLFLVVLLMLSSALLIFPELTKQGVETGLNTCARAILPSLFPFFVVTNLLTDLGYMERFGSSCLIMGLIGGYPVGAQAVVNQYRNGSISRDHAQKLILCCNNAGPAFIFGVAGYGVFQSFGAGIALYVIHALSALMIAAIVSLPHAGSCNRQPRRMPFAKAVTGSVRQAGATALQVCVYVIFFSVLCAYFQNMLPETRSQSVLFKLFLAMFELTGGVSQLSAIPNQRVCFCLISFLLGTGGLCVTLQTVSILDETDLSAGFYIGAKLLQGLFSILLSVPACAILKLTGSVPFRRFSTVFLAIPLIAHLFLLFLKKSSGNDPCHGV